MARQDFEFYSLAQGLPIFVVPKPENDYYKGLFVPSVEDLAVNGLHAAMSDNVPYEHTIKTSQGVFDPALAYERKTAAKSNPHDYATTSHTDVAICIPGIEEFGGEVHELRNNLYDWAEPLYRALITFGNNKGKPLVNTEETPEVIVERTTPERTDVQVTYLGVSGQASKPTYNALYADFLLARVYRWLEGPERKSELQPGVNLPGVYSPAAFNLLMSNSVRISLVPELSPQTAQ